MQDIRFLLDNSNHVTVTNKSEPVDTIRAGSWDLTVGGWSVTRGEAQIRVEQISQHLKFRKGLIGVRNQRLERAKI